MDGNGKFLAFARSVQQRMEARHVPKCNLDGHFERICHCGQNDYKDNFENKCLSAV